MEEWNEMQLTALIDPEDFYDNTLDLIGTRQKIDAQIDYCHVEKYCNLLDFKRQSRQFSENKYKSKMNYSYAALALFVFVK